MGLTSLGDFGYAPTDHDENEAPRSSPVFCQSCGSEQREGNFCAYCGNVLVHACKKCGEREPIVETVCRKDAQQFIENKLRVSGWKKTWWLGLLLALFSLVGLVIIPPLMVFAISNIPLVEFSLALLCLLGFALMLYANMEKEKVLQRSKTSTPEWFVLYNIRKKCPRSNETFGVPS